MPAGTGTRLDAREKARAYRERMRAREAHRQSRAVAGSAHEQEDQAFIDAISERGSA